MDEESTEEGSGEDSKMEGEKAVKKRMRNRREMRGRRA
jgi:hypothetical protein